MYQCSPIYRQKVFQK